jgi:hypothetical protein
MAFVLGVIPVAFVGAGCLIACRLLAAGWLGAVVVGLALSVVAGWWYSEIQGATREYGPVITVALALVTLAVAAVGHLGR